MPIVSDRRRVKTTNRARRSSYLLEQESAVGFLDTEHPTILINVFLRNLFDVLKFVIQTQLALLDVQSSRKVMKLYVTEDVSLVVNSSIFQLRTMKEIANEIYVLCSKERRKKKCRPHFDRNLTEFSSYPNRICHRFEVINFTVI